MSIAFLLDENIPFAFIELLEKNGYKVEHLKKINKVGIKNREVYKLAEKNKSWIITRDADFENYLKFNSYNIAGIILLKLTETKTQHLLNVMTKFINYHQDKLLKKHLIIIDEDSIKLY